MGERDTATQSLTSMGDRLVDVEGYFELRTTETEKGLDVEELFLSNPDAPGVIVEDEKGQLLGAISRLSFMTLLSSAFGRDLYLKRRLRHIVRKNEKLLARDVFDGELLVSEAIAKALERPSSQRFDPIVALIEETGKPRLLDMVSLLNQHLIYTQVLNQMISSASVEKDEMLAIASHDLKNPLGVITTMSELLQSPELSQDTREEFYGGIHANAKRMLEIITSFIDASRLEKDIVAPKLRKFKVEEILNSCLKVHFRSAKNKDQDIKVDWDFDSDLELYSDANQLQSVVDNLVSNAVKYSPKGGEISIHGFCSKRYFNLEVKDHGPGLTEDDQKKIFGKFVRLSAQPTGEEGSTGLGLYSVKKILDSLGGEVRFDSELGKGSRFKARLPLMKGTG